MHVYRNTRYEMLMWHKKGEQRMIETSWVERVRIGCTVSFRIRSLHKYPVTVTVTVTVTFSLPHKESILGPIIVTPESILILSWDTG
jgi:hypothetical protein